MWTMINHYGSADEVADMFVRKHFGKPVTIRRLKAIWKRSLDNQRQIFDGDYEFSAGGTVFKMHWGSDDVWRVSLKYDSAPVCNPGFPGD